MKPEWSEAPEWANWLAQDLNGSWYWYASRPSEGVTHWRAADVTGQSLVPSVARYKGNDEPEWKETLEERPDPLLDKIIGVITDKIKHHVPCDMVNLDEEYIKEVAQRILDTTKKQ